MNKLQTGSIVDSTNTLKCHGFISILQKHKRAVATSVIAVGLLLGTQQYQAQSNDKGKDISTNQEAVGRLTGNRSKAIPQIIADKPIEQWIPILSGDAPFTGGEDCSTARNVTTNPFNDSGTTVGSNNTITSYFNTNLNFPYSGPDRFYKIVTNATGTITASMTLTGSTLDGALFLSNACPPTSAANAIGNSIDLIGAGVGPEVLSAVAGGTVTVPAGTYWLAVDSYYAAPTAAASGPYSITIGVQNLATPTAATASISGRVVSSGGRGLGRVRVTVTKASGERVFATTNAFGYFRFNEMQAGETIVLSVASKTYQFSNPTQVISVEENIENLTFTALP
jgi:Carboxypeptidase regulatory-like domain